MSIFSLELKLIILEWVVAVFLEHSVEVLSYKDIRVIQAVNYDPFYGFWITTLYLIVGIDITAVHAVILVVVVGGAVLAPDVVCTPHLLAVLAPDVVCRAHFLAVLTLYLQTVQCGQDKNIYQLNSWVIGKTSYPIRA